MAPVVATVAASTALAVGAVSSTTAAVAGGVSGLTVNKKMINDAYMNVSSRCKLTLEDATRVAQAAHTQVKELCRIAKEFEQLELLNNIARY